MVTEQALFPNTFGMELIYSFVIIFCSLIIYFSTKEIYKLSNYPGIKYFREAFLFFALAYFFKSFISFLFLIFNVRGIIEFSSIFFGVLTLFFFIYASTMAIFYLLYSIVWKNLKENLRESKFTIPLIHIFVLVISATSIIVHETGVVILLQVFVFLFIAIQNYSSYRKLKSKKKSSSIHLIYLFLFVFWMLNLSDLLIVGFGPIIELVVSLASIGIFLVILYKVTRYAGINEYGKA
ncbi:hypothetical protein COU58_04700 [Candidatus Pacearchaeota archaeon CG10_big_fil_rev_8_21_14_0_10_32_42]|nr:MAG: hypothetical protein COU58_04700 [Candidatus Pacearchaeota archaeon CG10_big_fil_rev_8_21_14_0_10_32_42]